MGREIVCGHADGRITTWKTTVGRTVRIELVNEARVHESAVCSNVDLGNGRIASGGDIAESLTVPVPIGPFSARNASRGVGDCLGEDAVGFAGWSISET